MLFELDEIAEALWYVGPLCPDPGLEPFCEDLELGIILSVSMIAAPSKGICTEIFRKRHSNFGGKIQFFGVIHKIDVDNFKITILVQIWSSIQTHCVLTKFSQSTHFFFGGKFKSLKLCSIQIPHLFWIRF